MSLICCSNNSAVSRYLASEPEGDVSEELELHLDSCEICVATLTRELEQASQPDWLTLVRESRTPAPLTNILSRLDTSRNTIRQT
jgi:hypothetical protein